MRKKLSFAEEYQALVDKYGGQNTEAFREEYREFIRRNQKPAKVNPDQGKFLLDKLTSIEGKLDAMLQLFLKAATRDLEPRVEEPIVPSDLPPPRDIYTPQRRL